MRSSPRAHHDSPTLHRCKVCVPNTCIKPIFSAPKTHVLRLIHLCVHSFVLYHHSFVPAPISYAPTPALIELMYSQSGTSESGVLYLVKDRGGKHQVVRRTKTPTTSPPLHDDFDAITTQPPTEWNNRASWVPTTAPMPSDFDEISYSALTGPAPSHSGVNRRVRDYTTPFQSTRRTQSFTSGPSRTSSRHPSQLSFSQTPRRQLSHDELEMELVDYGEFGEYTREMQQVFPSSRGFEVSVSKTSTRHPRRGDLPSNPVRRPANWSARPGRGAPKGTVYDMVRDKVLEDTGEKTVIISTWRERVAEETKTEDMSVYYLSPRDYEFQEEAFRARQEAQGKDVDSSDGMSVDEQGSPWSPAGIERRRNTSLRPRNDSIASLRTPEGHRSVNSSTTPRKIPFASTPQKKREDIARHASERPRTSSPMPSPLEIIRDRRISRSHTPVRHPTSFGGSSSSPREKRPSPPFIPTRSGSTISSIKSKATTHFQHILASCDPPLMHLSDTLVGLGINSEEHLRAMGRMKDEVRDKVVKEEAFRQGVTVMEWALLLDKVQALS
ncbi:hypothetical protein CYLTODRAFT_416324 [Cylindrobasidium torrendii FP15055 ss-10]|uniref:Uncharacterized protein n=1 Tax=Cylindrobasidium torrendii FP15055 ss-10 TaxID=1314674 RepID=A0A0D7BUF2_9AGAR|nr:hypothetical protein CYLTODRAFT_416324 [Cylindrobasidium torrendii FP15055 ss-10]